VQFLKKKTKYLFTKFSANYVSILYRGHADIVKNLIINSCWYQLSSCVQLFVRGLNWIVRRSFRLRCATRCVTSADCRSLLRSVCGNFGYSSAPRRNLTTCRVIAWYMLIAKCLGIPANATDSVSSFIHLQQAALPLQHNDSRRSWRRYSFCLLLLQWGFQGYML